MSIARDPVWPLPPWTSSTSPAARVSLRGEHRLPGAQTCLAFRLGGEFHALPDGRVAEHVVVLVAQHVDRIGRDAVDDVVGGAGVKDLYQGLPGRRRRCGAGGVGG